MDLRTRNTCGARATRGMATVETVIVLPLLLMLLFGIAEFSLVLSRWQAVTNAAREGARTAIVFRSSCVVADVEAAVRQRVKDYATPLGITLNDSQIQISGVCGTSNTNSTVRVTSPYQFRVLGSFAPSLSPTVNTTGTSVMRNEGTS